MTGRRRKMRDKGIKQYNALYAAAVKNGYSVTDEQVQAYIEDMKTTARKRGQQRRYSRRDRPV